MLIQLDVTRGPVTNLRMVLIPPGALPPTLEGDAKSARLHQLDAYRWAIVFPQLSTGTTELRVRF